jgi:microcompartment protein CcmL/EutN
LSDPDLASLDPAVGVLEFASISAGIVAGDAMVKASPVGSIYAGTVHPGKYLVLVSGDTASVDAALEVGRSVTGEPLIDETFLPDIHPALTAAITQGNPTPEVGGDALGIVETTTVAALVRAADAGVKAAAVSIATIRLADDLGGKSYVMFGGDLPDVEASVEAAVAVAPASLVVRFDVIAQLHAEMAANLVSEARFNRRVALRPTERST